MTSKNYKQNIIPLNLNSCLQLGTYNTTNKMFNIVTCLLKAKISKLAETALAANTSFARQRPVNIYNETAFPAQSEDSCAINNREIMGRSVFYAVRAEVL
jgi:hypothetical protein